MCLFICICNNDNESKRGHEFEREWGMRAREKLEGGNVGNYHSHM